MLLASSDSAEMSQDQRLISLAAVPPTLPLFPESAVVGMYSILLLCRA
jgi:hypothetical protein